MQIQVDATDVVRRADLLEGAGELLLEEILRVGYARSKDAARFAQRRFREGGTTATRTARRTSALYDAYDGDAERGEDQGLPSVLVSAGLIKPDTDAEVLHYGRVHEGIDASGQRVDKFTILPRASEFLKFRLPPEKGGGFVMTRGPIELKPRPTLPAIQERLLEQLPKDVEAAFQRVVGVA